MVKRLWNQFKEYMNIEVDREVARVENSKALKMILTVGLLNSLLLIVLDKIVFDRVRYVALIGCCIFLFFLAFSYMNWPELKDGITIEVELVTLLMLVPVGIIEYLPKAEDAAFLYLILLILLPSLILDKPWHLLAMVLLAGVFALFRNHTVIEDSVRDRNFVRILSVTFLASVFISHYAHSRIKSFHLRRSTQVVAEHDPLTGIYNRAGGIKMIRDCIDKQESGTFLIIDIDDFKLVNDRYGHQKGDEVLKQVAGILQSSFKQTDIVMRMGGDEFIIYAAGMVDFEVSRKRLELLNKAIHKVVLDEKAGKYVTVSIGGAINDGSYPTYDALYKASDQYLYQTKAKGKDGYSLLGTSYKRGPQ
ncbi:MAG: GGDEF domain-containing protein [Butyrivibrio sp.]|nr:GGDEF domain-containing protein [Butyrivibrio sp.]